MSFESHSQDTIRYEGVLKDVLLYESIELYPNNTFQWTSEYDLKWSEFGYYKLSKDSLILIYYSVNDAESLDSISKVEKWYKKEVFELEGNKIFRLNENKKRIKTREEKSIRTAWSWIFGYRYKYEIIRRD